MAKSIFKSKFSGRAEEPVEWDAILRIFDVVWGIGIEARSLPKYPAIIGFLDASWVDASGVEHQAESLDEVGQAYQRFETYSISFGGHLKTSPICRFLYWPAKAEVSIAIQADDQTIVDQVISTVRKEFPLISAAKQGKVLMTSRSYTNFDLSIVPDGDHYRAHVLQSCIGEGSTKFELPFSSLELENFILKMGHARRRMRHGVHNSDSPELAAAKEFGAKLFRAVFQGDVYACLQASLNDAPTHEQGVRVLLRLPLGLTNVPWEYLYNPDSNRFFSLSAHTPLVRYLNLTPTIHPWPVKSPLRLLVAISSPSDYGLLDVEHEWRDLQSALQPLIERNLVKISRLESASFQALQHELRHDTYHIFHFIGHGSFDDRKQDGVLIFTDEQGCGNPLSGQTLGTLLCDHKSLRLAVLNSCEGARTGQDDLFAGVAHSLVQMGLPAVIAMQYEISDSAAILFAKEFYMTLAEGHGVDTALSEARKAISNDRDSVEWGTPVLFSRILDGQIFDLVPTQPPVDPPIAIPSPPSLPQSSEPFHSVPALGEVIESQKSNNKQLELASERALQIEEFDLQLRQAMPGSHRYTQAKSREDINRVLHFVGENRRKYDLWWTQGIGNNPIDRIQQEPDDLWLINEMECKIKDLWIFRYPTLERQYIIVQTQAMPSFGISNYTGTNEERAGYFQGRYIEFRQFEDGFAIIDGKSVELIGSEFRRRFLHDEFIILAPRASVYIAVRENDLPIVNVLQSLKEYGAISGNLLAPLEKLKREFLMTILD